MATVISTQPAKSVNGPIQNHGFAEKNMGESGIKEFHEQLIREGIAVLQVTTKKGSIYEGEIQQLNNTDESITLINYRLLTIDEGIDLDNSPPSVNKEVCIPGKEISEMRMVNPKGDKPKSDANIDISKAEVNNRQNKNDRSKRNRQPRTFVRQNTDFRRRSFPMDETAFSNSFMNDENMYNGDDGRGRRNRPIRTSIMITADKVIPAFRLYNGRSVQSFMRNTGNQSYYNSVADNNSSYSGSRILRQAPRLSDKRLQRDAQRLERMMAGMKGLNVSPKNIDMKDGLTDGKEDFYDSPDLQELCDLPEDLMIKQDLQDKGQWKRPRAMNKNAFNSRTFGPQRNFHRGYFH